MLVFAAALHIVLVGNLAEPTRSWLESVVREGANAAERQGHARGTGIDGKINRSTDGTSWSLRLYSATAVLARRDGTCRCDDAALAVELIRAAFLLEGGKSQPPAPPARPQLPPPPPYSVEQNAARDGGRFNALSERGVEQCEALCDADEKCRAFTYVRPGAWEHHPGPQCYLFDDQPTAHPDACCATALKPDGR